jgi:hypothetical protein
MDTRLPLLIGRKEFLRLAGITSRRLSVLTRQGLVRQWRPDRSPCRAKYFSADLQRVKDLMAPGAAGTFPPGSPRSGRQPLDQGHAD